ncbi:hypothetical protein E2986_00274 [Frieseomelitta varia]|uniref:C-type lectin domain-containing protein n=1 Tax=Frieseomelitta varia TaxID=561572 RepID=A0A833S7D9_9HYME|nr:hypothetical protein E2986_00274 [Frieseomelitta varia]
MTVIRKDNISKDKIVHVLLGDLYSISATNSSNVSMMEPTGLWSEILENWIVSNSKIKRMSKVMKLGDKSLTVTSKISMPNKREVSETDLYLLGAIEKLVYRVDFLESRLRRAEELLYYVISGTINKKGKGPGPFYAIMYQLSPVRRITRKLVKTAITSVIVTLIGSKTFWTGGLNPGLLWIWASSAKPVYQNTKHTVPGDGRCLKLSYNSTSRLYSYQSDDCGAKHKYACKLTKDDESANKIEKAARMLMNE